MALLRILIASVSLMLAGSAYACQCTGCGCKGGPGFRGPNGRCVSYKQIDKVCGSPPTTHCAFEHHKQECEHKGAMPDEKGMERYRRSIGSIAQ